eukprot:1322650-Alexandrium_andersonii.AAC.1
MPWPGPWAPCSRTSPRSRLTSSSACHSSITLTPKQARMLRPSWMLRTSTRSLALSGLTLPASRPRPETLSAGCRPPAGMALRPNARLTTSSG